MCDVMLLHFDFVFNSNTAKEEAEENAVYEPQK